MYECGVYLLGVNLGLAQAEVEALVKSISESVNFNWHGRFGIITSVSNPIPFLRRRLVLTHEIGRIVASTTDVTGEDVDISLSGINKSQEDMTFAVNVIDVDSVLKSGEKSILASKLGQQIQKLTSWSVSLKNPQKTYTLFTMQKKWVICESYPTSLFKILKGTHPKQYPFFHPSMMNSVLARVMCNIAGILPNDIVLDPFCGAGGILIQVQKIGARMVGIDRNWKLLTGARFNLAVQSLSDYTLIQGDSRYLPLDYVDCIVTDPPYGKSSSTQGADNKELVESYVNGVMDWEKLRTMCICADSKMNLNQFFEGIDVDIITRVSIRVHRSLTREIFRVDF